MHVLSFLAASCGFLELNPVAELLGELGDFGYGNRRIIDVGNVEEEKEGLKTATWDSSLGGEGC